MSLSSSVQSCPNARYLNLVVVRFRNMEYTDHGRLQFFLGREAACYAKSMMQLMCAFHSDQVLMAADRPFLPVK